MVYTNALVHKAQWRIEFERCDRAGIPRPDPVPHPDDIKLDPDSLGVRIQGARTAEEKRLRDHIIVACTALVIATRKLDRQAKRGRLSPEEERTRKRNQEIIDEMKTLLPERYWEQVFTKPFIENPRQIDTANEALALSYKRMIAAGG